jgi:hypothetical protein
MAYNFCPTTRLAGENRVEIRKTNDTITAASKGSVFNFPQYIGEIMTYKLLSIVILAVIVNGCADKSATTPDLVISDPNRVFNCWEQKWDCGDWIPLKEKPDRSTYMRWKVKGDWFGCSVCEYCSANRIIHLGDNKERILYNLLTSHKQCKHLWKKGTSEESSDAIKKGEGFAVCSKGRLCIALVEEVENSVSDDGTDNSYMRYKYAEIRRSDVEESSVKVRLNQLLWKTAECKKYFMFWNDIGIPVDFFYLEEESQDAFVIRYPARYGGSKAYDNVDSSLYKVAIVDKKEINKGVVDLTKYRFKSWQDGMGNKCEE